MNAYYGKVPASFGPETRFEVRLDPPAPFRATWETELERLKNRMLREFLSETPKFELNGYVRRAANEAEALAWVTQYPLLVFPDLFKEKAQAALLQADRQKQIRGRSLELLPRNYNQDKEDDEGGRCSLSGGSR